MGRKKDILITAWMVILCQLIPISWAQEGIWIPMDEPHDFRDVHAAFRGRFTLDEEAELEFRLSGASWYRIWIDGNILCEGPDRAATVCA